MAPVFWALLRHYLHIVDLNLCIVSKPFICCHERVPAPLGSEETEHKYERRIKDLFRNVPHNGAAKEELINHIFCAFLN